MSRFAELMLEDLDKETVNWGPNYDETEKEPLVLPSAFPNLLVNGSTGIAVGMATNMAPHNLREVTAAIKAYIGNPDLTSEDLAEFVTGPDFPTGGMICGRSGIRSAYLTGRGRVIVRARTHIETLPNGRERIIATEIPYMVNKANLLEKIAQLVREKKLEGISDIRDESDRRGMRVVIELKRDAISDVVLNHLYKYTSFQTTFAIYNLALVNKQPMLLTLRDLVRHYVDHRHEVLVRRTEFELAKAKARAHILEGLRIAQQNIDEVVRIIRSSSDTDAARKALESRFGLSEIQSDAIVQMRLRQITGLEIEKIEEEFRQLMLLIADLEDILARRERRMAIIAARLDEVAEKFGDARRTSIEEAVDDIDIEDLIADEPMVVTLSETGYIKRVPIDTFRSQGRGGVGVSGGDLKEEDSLRSLFVASNHSYLLVFTNLGRLHWMKVYHIPEGTRTSRGKAIVNLLQLSEGESVAQIVPVQGEFDPARYLMLATRQGTINKISLGLFANPRKGGIIAVELMDGDQLVDVVLSTLDHTLMLASRKGQAIAFPPSAFRALGRGTRGVRGMTLEADDQVISMVVLEPGTQVLTLTEHGYGKRTAIDEYRITNRGGKGIRNLRVTDKTGDAVRVSTVHEDWEIIVTTRNGTVIRTPIQEIPTYGRDSQGVRVIRLRDDDAVMDVACLDGTMLEKAAQAAADAVAAAERKAAMAGIMAGYAANGQAVESDEDNMDEQSGEQEFDGEDSGADGQGEEE
jgi:DNA gyrase subunit A